MFKYRETNTKEETESLYQEYLKAYNFPDTEEVYNDFYNDAESEGFEVDMIIECDKELTGKLGIFVPKKDAACFYVFRAKNREEE